MKNKYSELTPERLLYCIKINSDGEELLRVLKAYHYFNDDITLVDYLITPIRLHTTFISALFYAGIPRGFSSSRTLLYIIKTLEEYCMYFCTRLIK